MHSQKRLKMYIGIRESEETMIRYTYRKTNHDLGR